MLLNGLEFNFVALFWVIYPVHLMVLPQFPEKWVDKYSSKIIICAPYVTLVKHNLKTLYCVLPACVNIAIRQLPAASNF